MAEWQGDALHVWLSTQGCSAMAEDLADRLDMKREDVHVNCEHVGGAFGAKLGYTPETELAVRLLSHAPPGKAFRGPGGPQGIFAIEQAMDALAVARKEDPIALRRRSPKLIPGSTPLA